MLDSGYRAFFDINYVLLLGVATSQPILVKIGHEMKEWYQFSEIQVGGSRHVGFRLPGDYRYHRCGVIVATFTPDFVKIGEKFREQYQF